MWDAGFRFTNTPARTRFVQQLAWPAMRATFRGIADRHVPDVIVSTHPLLTAPLRRVFPHTPILVVVTDLISGHVSWYDGSADLTMVPTLVARDAAVRCGIPKESISVPGVPVSRKFVAIPGERAAAALRRASAAALRLARPDAATHIAAQILAAADAARGSITETPQRSTTIARTVAA